MIGRIYDPRLGRFLQADPIVQDLTYSQSLNRYSYGFNSPLSGTDPSGYEFLGLALSIFYTVLDFVTDEPAPEPMMPGGSNPIADHVAVGTLGSAFRRSAVIQDPASYTRVTAIETTVGGTASETTSSKFANGASTGSFLYATSNIADLECGVHLNCGTPPLAGPAKVLGAVLKGAAAGLGRLRVALASKSASTAVPKAFRGLSESGRLLDPVDKAGQLTRAGRALQKHGGRQGSAFPSARGNPVQINQQGQQVLDDILGKPGAAVRPGNRFGGVDVISTSGRGARFDARGIFRGFLEP